MHLHRAWMYVFFWLINLFDCNVWKQTSCLPLYSKDRILLKSVLNTNFILCYFSYHIYYFPLFNQQVLNIHWVLGLLKMQEHTKPELGFQSQGALTPLMCSQNQVDSIPFPIGEAGLSSSDTALPNRNDSKSMCVKHIF